MAVSSKLVPEKPDGTADPAHQSLVLRGSLYGATAAMVLKPEGIMVSVNGPSGENILFNVPPLKRGNDSLQEEEVDKDHVFRGPIVSGEFEVAVPTPEADGNESAANSSRTVSMLHLSPQGGHSIHISKHIHHDGEAKDPVNAIFYHHATPQNVDSTLENNNWLDTLCGSTKRLLIYDEQHGGTDEWWEQGQDHDKESNNLCGDARYHLRRYTSKTGDTHSPGFEDYILAPAHWEDTGHDFVDPQRGQDELLSDLGFDSDIGNYWHIQVTHGSNECVSCGEWDGWVDIYNRILSSDHDPCDSGGDGPEWWIYKGTPYMTIDWTC